MEEGGEFMTRRSTYTLTARSTHVLTLSEVKAHLHVDHSDDDTLITGLLYGAENQAETILRRSLLSTELVLRLDCFPSSRLIELDRGPVISLTSVIYKDANDATQTLAGSYYTLDNYAIPDVIALEPDLYWPQTKTGRRNAVLVTYLAGWASAAVVPDEIKIAILHLIGHWYSNKEAVVMSSIGYNVPNTFETMLWPHRDLRFS
jgi:uncharacterized phiE125 gp8 family phage protein